MNVLIFLAVLSPYTTVIPSIYATYMMFSKKVIIYKNSWNLSLFLLFIWSIFVGILNHSLISIAASFAFFMYLCVSIVMQNYCDNEDNVEKIYRYLVKFSVFSAILAIVEKLIFIFFGINIWKPLLIATNQPVFMGRIYSTFGNPNVAGNWFAIMVLIGIYFNDKSTKRNKLFYRIATVLFFVALCFTGSRGAYAGLYFGLMVYNLLRRNKKNIIILLAICAIGLIISTFFNQSINLDNLTDHDIDDSFNSRFGIWIGCLKMIKIKPITGWGLLGLLNPEPQFFNNYYYKTMFHGHNIWITFFTTLGIIGLGIYLYMKLNLYKNIKMLYCRNCKLAPLLAAIQGLILVHGIVDFTIMAPQTGLLFIVCSAMVSSLATQRSVISIQNPIQIPVYSSLSKTS